MKHRPAYPSPERIRRYRVHRDGWTLCLNSFFFLSAIASIIVLFVPAWRATVSIARAVRPRLADVVGTLGSSFSFAAPVIGLLHARSLNEWCVRMRQESATYLADWTCDHMSSQHMSSHRMR